LLALLWGGNTFDRGAVSACTNNNSNSKSNSNSNSNNTNNTLPKKPARARHADRATTTHLPENNHRATPTRTTRNRRPNTTQRPRNNHAMTTQTSRNKRPWDAQPLDTERATNRKNRNGRSVRAVAPTPFHDNRGATNEATHHAPEPKPTTGNETEATRENEAPTTLPKHRRPQRDAGRPRRSATPRKPSYMWAFIRMPVAVVSTTAANNNNDTDCTADKCATITP